MVARSLVARSFVAALLLAVLSACGPSSGPGAAVTGVRSSDDDGYLGVKLDQPYVVPPLTLRDTSGRSFELARQPRRTVVFFGYTHCPDLCQTVMSTIASAWARLSVEDRARLQMAFVTTDPARDSGAVLRRYLDRFNPRFTGLTGSLSQIDALGRPMAVYVKKGRQLPSGGYEVDHGTQVITVRHARGDLLWTAATSPADIAADLHKILKADA